MPGPPNKIQADDMRQTKRKPCIKATVSVVKALGACVNGGARLRVGGHAGGGGERELQLSQLLARAQQEPQQRRQAQLLRACAAGAPQLSLSAL